MANAELQSSPISLTFRSMHEDADSEYLSRGSAADIWKVTKRIPDNSQKSLYVSKMIRISPGDFGGLIGTARGDLDRHHQQSQNPFSWEDFVKKYKSKVSEWSQLDHDNIIRVYDLREDLNLLVEFCPNGSVRDYLKTRAGRQVNKVEIISDVLLGLQYLHRRDPPIFHGSLNAGKLFVDARGRTKIGEFGLTAQCYYVSRLARLVNFTGFSRWMSPELFSLNLDGSGIPTSASDIWALACAMFEIVSEQLPYPEYKHDVRIQRAILKGEHPGRRDKSTEGLYNLKLWSTMEACWSMDPSQRPSIESIIDLCLMDESRSAVDKTTEKTGHSQDTFKGMNPSESFLSSMLPSRSRSPTSNKPLPFHRYLSSKIPSYPTSKLWASGSIPNPLVPHTPNVIEADPKSPTSTKTTEETDRFLDTLTMDTLEDLLASISPSRSELPTPAQPRKFSKYCSRPRRALKLSSSTSSSSLLALRTPNAIAANPNTLTSNLRASSPSCEEDKGVPESRKSPPSSPVKGRTSAIGTEAQTDLVKLEDRVKQGAAAANSTAEQVQSWANELIAGAVHLLGWSQSFARVVDLDVLLGGDPQGGSEAVRAFTTVAQSLEDLSKELAAVIKEELVPQLQRLAKTTREPLLLLAHMHTLASAHHNLVNAPYSKSRPAALLEASQAYLALAAQLREELPRYVDMFERAFGIVVLRLSGWQARYFQEAERRWKEFWLALNVEESEVGAGESAAIETVRIWWSRWEATARQTAGMSIVTPGRRVYGGGANGERGDRDRGRGDRGPSHGDRERPSHRDPSASAYPRQQQPAQPSTPSSDGASWDYVPPYHSKPSAHSLGDQQSAASASSSAKGHSRAVSTDFASRVPRNRSGASLAPRVQSDPAPERLLPKGKKSQRSSNLRKVTDTLFGGTPGDTTPARNSAHSSSSRIHQPVLYAAAAIHPFNPETDATHLGLPFLSLQIGDTLEILVEAGHPSEHSNLPIPYDDAPDCMLAARNEEGVEGWALASYLMPLT